MIRLERLKTEITITDAILLEDLDSFIRASGVRFNDLTDLVKSKLIAFVGSEEDCIELDNYHETQLTIAKAKYKAITGHDYDEERIGELTEPDPLLVGFKD